MPNELFGLFHRNKSSDSVNHTPFQAPFQMDQFKSFYNQAKAVYNGNPEAEVKELLRSGAMTQDQFNYLTGLYNSLKGLL